MKIYCYNINLTKTFKLFFLLSFTIIISCQNQNGNSPQQNQSNNELIKKKTETPTPQIEGTGYTQAEIENLINSRRREIVVKDTAEVYNQVNCGDIFDLTNFKITTDSILKYKTKNYIISEELKKLLYVSNCFKKVKETDKFVAYILFTDLESHFSEVARLILISKKNYEIKRIDLAYFYANEQQEKIVGSTFKNNETFLRETKTNYSYIHGIGKIDSTEVKQEWFKINESGSFEKLN